MKTGKNLKEDFIKKGREKGMKEKTGVRVLKGDFFSFLMNIYHGWNERNQ